MLAYGEDKAIQDAFEAGANGFIVVDPPPEEAATFRAKCTSAKCVLTSFPMQLCLTLKTQTILRSPDCTIYNSPPHQVLGFYRRFLPIRRIEGTPYHRKLFHKNLNVRLHV